MIQKFLDCAASCITVLTLFSHDNDTLTSIGENINCFYVQHDSWLQNIKEFHGTEYFSKGGLGSDCSSKFCHLSAITSGQSLVMTLGKVISK